MMNSDICKSSKDIKTGKHDKGRLQECQLSERKDVCGKVVLELKPG